MAKIALYLAGGGARGAYQAGVLKAISHILQSKTLPFAMVSGVSIGCINAAIIAQHADDFPLGIEKLEELWSNICCQQIFNSSNYQLSKSFVRNLTHLLIKQQQTGHLLDTTPLHQFINQHINFDKIRENIANNVLETMEVISNCYETQQTISFYQHSKSGFEDWHYPRHISQHTEISREHLLASSALPLFFPTVKIDGFHYGDGGMGLVAPLRGAVRFNVEKILILGTRQLPVFPEADKLRNGDIGFAHILGNMLNGLFLDNLDRDIEMVNRMNDIARLISMWNKRHSPWRPIETLHLRPSINVSEIAQAQYQSMPALLRFLLNVLGAQSHSGDLLSFLLFEKEFTLKLLELGYKDTLASADVVTAFFA
jgi:NTE family protein